MRTMRTQYNNSMDMASYLRVWRMKTWWVSEVSRRGRGEGGEGREDN